MSKKMMLLALAVASMAMFALPATVSGQEDHIDRISTFSGTIDKGGSLVASGEPTITCNHGHVFGGFEAGGTTGAIEIDFTECHTTVFGFTAKCHTPGSLGDTTIATGGTLHLITINNKPAVLVTPVTTEVVCAGIANTHVEGNGVIGTITSPACNVTSNTQTIKFEATGSTQNHISYTGVSYDLTARTGIGAQRTAGLNATATLTSDTAGELTCT